MYFQRKIVLEEIISQLEKEVERLKTSYEHSVTASREAPPRMETRYDTRKDDMAQLAHAQNDLIAETVKNIGQLKKLAESDLPVKSVNIGIFALLKNLETGDQTLFLLTELGGGKKYQTSAGDITVVTSASPFGSQLKGKMVSQIITINEVRFVVLQIF